MFALTTKRAEECVVALNQAVFCLDCEMISDSRGDECPACNSRSLVSLPRMLGGTLGARRKPEHRNGEAELFDIEITIGLQQMAAHDVTTTLESLSNVIASHLARGQATLHIKLNPPLDELKV